MDCPSPETGIGRMIELFEVRRFQTNSSKPLGLNYARDEHVVNMFLLKVFSGLRIFTFSQRVLTIYAHQMRNPVSDLWKNLYGIFSTQTVRLYNQYLLWGWEKTFLFPLQFVEMQ